MDLKWWFRLNGRIRKTLTAMVRRYDFDLADNQVIEMQPLVTLRPKNGIQMKLKFRG